LEINIIWKNKFRAPKEKRKQLKELIKSISGKENKELSCLNIIFCCDEFIRQYNKEYLGHDYETDIITFHDVNKEGQIEGELLISTDTVSANCKRFRTNFDNELNRVIIHGVLHLCGYRDNTTAEKMSIKKKENFYLKNIQIDAGKNY
jgi:rRNA maturation RNase YbeY